jgi:glutathione peroxidase
LHEDSDPNRGDGPAAEEFAYASAGDLVSLVWDPTLAAQRSITERCEVDSSIFNGIAALDGDALDPAQLEDKVVLLVNVASRCGLTTQYEGLERLQKRFADRGFTVLGVPCNQFAGQEPGSADEIREFCSATYGTTFPLTEKLDVNGHRRHPLFDWLTEATDADGRAGEIDWNFEKFLVSREGTVVARFRPPVEPESEEVVAAIEAALGAQPPATRTVKAGEVKVGDRVLDRGGNALLVSRIDQGMLGQDGLLAFVEDSPARWAKLPTASDAEVQVLTGAEG